MAQSLFICSLTRTRGLSASAPSRGFTSAGPWLPALRAGSRALPAFAPSPGVLSPFIADFSLVFLALFIFTLTGRGFPARFWPYGQKEEKAARRAAIREKPPYRRIKKSGFNPDFFFRLFLSRGGLPPRNKKRFLNKGNRYFIGRG